MAVPVHLILKDDGGSQIIGSCDVHGRDGSIELRSRGISKDLAAQTVGSCHK
ncbi:hypothetical protein SAMN05192562_10175 [Kosakonia arachidis]|uniref:Uncharacterized protein n=1 Tax=Kosakonia arachidis TaxID=551989 RepID=A0A1I6XMD8_9ENTR|nr:hypothetical protein SAMN05192562_10175 [Kosakonia arachidis]